MSTEVKALLLSYWRVFLAAALAAYLSLGVAPLDLGLSDAKTLGNAGIAAALLTLFNYVRPGETRFGVHAKDVGMGGEDKLGPDGVVQL